MKSYEEPIGFLGGGSLIIEKKNKDKMERLVNDEFESLRELLAGVIG